MLLVTSILIGLLLALFIWLSRNISKQYVSDVFILMQPFTNAVLASSFEKQLKQVIPGVSKLHFQESFRVTHAPNRQSTTYTQLVVQIDALGESPSLAISNANQIAPQVCSELKRLFPNAAIKVLNPAVGARQFHALQWPSLRFGQRRTLEYTLATETVAFVGTGIQISPGHEWKQHYSASHPCSPVLIGTADKQGEAIIVSMQGEDHTDFETVVAEKRESIQSAIKSFTSSTTDSVHNEDFITTTSRLFVACISHYQNDNTGKGLMRSKHCEYITTNAVGKFVSIHHVVTPADKTNNFRQIILQSLKLK